MEVQYVPVSLAEGVPPRTLQKGLSRGKRLGDTSAVTKQIGDESAMTRQKSCDRASFFVCRCLMRNLGYTCTSIHTYVSTVRTKSGSSGRESLDQRTKRQLLPACASLAEGKAITTKERWRSESRIQKGGGGTGSSVPGRVSGRASGCGCEPEYSRTKQTTDTKRPSQRSRALRQKYSHLRRHGALMVKVDDGVVVAPRSRRHLPLVGRPAARQCLQPAAS